MQLKVALDWTANTLHAGFYLAHHKQWYQRAGLEVVFEVPSSDNQAPNPVERLLAGKVAFAIAPSEYVVQEHLRGKGELVAVATLLQENVTAWATYKRGRVVPYPIYAALDIPFEESVINRFRHYQPRFRHLKLANPSRLETWELLKTGEADWCWIFLPWEGAEAAHFKLPIDFIRLSEAGIPYGYCPLLLTTRKQLAQHGQYFDDFVRYTAAGYFHAVDYPKDSALILEQYIAADPRLIYKSLIEVTKAALQVDGSWGVMQKSRWSDYAQWLLEQKMIDRLPDVERMFSNVLLVENSFLS
jgi:ABC-type nitrate/sulfonate/bicarbonate transport system substrate-binding protein